MHAYGKARRLRRFALGMTLTAALGVTLAACSSSGGTATHHVSAIHPAAVASAATTPASSAPAPAAAADASGLSGKWSGQYGGGYQGTFILHWRQLGSKLRGTISLTNPAINLPIHGSVAGGSIRFGTVGSYGITYSGKVSGNSMSGTYQVLGGTGSSGNWNASKS